MKLCIIQIVALMAVLAAPGAFAAGPTIVCSGDQTLECTNSSGDMAVVQATVTFDGPENLMVIWAVNGEPALTNVIASGTASNGVTLTFAHSFSNGSNDVTVGVTADGTNVVMCSSAVNVQDTTPPVITKLVATPTVIWPPNHKLVNVRLVVRDEDSCGDVTWKIAGVTSNEAVDAPGSGQTSPDWIITDDHHLKVRAERSGRGSGRVYTISVEATDASGNIASQDVTVIVPHDHGRKHWVEPGDDDDDDNAQGDNNSQGNGKGHGKGKGKGKGH